MAAVLTMMCGPVLAAAELPTGLAGSYRVKSAVGDDPGLLEVAKGSDLVGKTVTLTNDKVALWSVYAGHPSAIRTADGMLETILGVPADLRTQFDFPEAHRSLRFTEIAFDQCNNDGKPMQACPVIVFAQDPKTGDLSLVTTPWGLARLQRLH